MRLEVIPLAEAADMSVTAQISSVDLRIARLHFEMLMLHDLKLILIFSLVLVMDGQDLTVRVVGDVGLRKLS